MAALERLGGETWFRLGDRDLATHVERTRRLAAGDTLSEVTHYLCQRLGISSRIVPMSDARVKTRVTTGSGMLSFQQYFVRRRAEPAVTEIHYSGAADAAPAVGALEALGDPRLRAIFIAPSNPWLSIDPILAVPALREAVCGARVPVVAVSPIVGGAALKGPTAKIMTELGLPVSCASIARHYRECLDGLILDVADTAEIAAIEEAGLAVVATATVMRSIEDRTSLARFAVHFAASLEKMRKPGHE
jgi:LPPG:FO 2-phospho-L-lactate transferase